ncbi:transposase family protein [Streptomyces sp. NPDC056821]|uniref:transposase family protein n=1 Tax=unclassified Streptomyces TaxID=2593676 RepID=UPI0036A0710C
MTRPRLRDEPLAAPDGTPLWVSEVEPGSTPDITAARIHVLPALYRAAAEGLPTLADKGYIGAEIGIHVPVRRPKGQTEQALHADTRTTNALIRDLRALGERTAVELKERWRALKRVTLSPSRDWRHSAGRPCPQRQLEMILSEKTSLSTSEGACSDGWGGNVERSRTGPPLLDHTRRTRAVPSTSRPRSRSSTADNVVTSRG